MIRFAPLALTAALLASPGCAAVLVTVSQPTPFGGVRASAAALADGRPGSALLLFDLPFSFVADLLLLPYTIPASFGEPDLDVPPAEQAPVPTYPAPREGAPSPTP